MSDQIRLAIAGLGHVADFQLDALERLKDRFRIVGVCDPKPEQFSKVAGVPTFLNLQEMLDTCPSDYLLVSVPNQDHFKVAEAALLNGVSVVVEKPPTETVDEFLKLQELASEHNLLLHTAFHASFAAELVWYVKARKEELSSLGPLTGIRCGFFDPYIENGVLVPHASSLGGSWIDSGINALSVVARLVPEFSIEATRLTHLPQFECSQVQGSVDFSFPIHGSKGQGQGLIETNWALRINHKSTDLFFGTTGSRLCLDHTDQTAQLLEPSGDLRTLCDFSADCRRMTAHYLGVFEDLYDAFRARLDNRAEALSLLRKLTFSG